MNNEISDKLIIRFSESIYVSRSKLPRSEKSIRTVAIPNSASALIGRILHHNYLVNEYIPIEKGGACIEISAPMGRKLVKIDLRQSEEISFRIKHLVSWTKKIQLRTNINLSIVHISTGMNFIQIATGPGSIVLEISGNPEIVNDVSELLPPERLIAWQSDAEFTVFGAHTMKDIYFNGPVVQLPPGFVAMLDSDNGETRSIPGIWSFVKKFYTP